MVEVDPTKIYHSKTKLNKFGNYPVWMNQRQIKKVKKRLNVTKKKSSSSKNKISKNLKKNE
jgi:hypothetical protein